MSGFEDVVADVPRDRWGRPLVIPPGGGNAIAYTRVTTFIDVLDDPFNLTQWKRRMVALGLAQRPDLLLRVTSLGPEPAKETEGGAAYKRWKKQMDETCDAAVEAAKASASATIGTALHALTERMDRGQDVGVVPDSYKPHLKAYEDATKNMTAVHIERFTVNDELRVGGTPDRVLRIDGHPKLVIGDLKSGDVVYGILKIAQQLAIYAHAQLYNPADGTRTSLGDVDLERGLIIALNARSGKCELLWVDLTRGWAAVQISKTVRDARNWKDLSKPYEQPNRDLTVEAQAALEAGIRGAPTVDDLVHLWTVAGNQWQPRHTKLAAARKAELQQRHLTIVS
jgi:hypothetical protein